MAVSRRNLISVSYTHLDGTVIYDNEADASVMENHKDRPEVIAAQKYGETKKIRWSSTLSVHTFYYAALKEDGSVLRIAKPVSYTHLDVYKRQSFYRIWFFWSGSDRSFRKRTF